MNMGSIGIYLFIVTVSCITANKRFITVRCKTENIGQYGQKSLLECVVSAPQEVTNLQIRVVFWKKEGTEEPLVGFYRGNTNQMPGYSFAEPSWNEKNMNVSLLITNTAVHDEEDYTCTVMTNGGSGFNRTSLKVRAQYSTPTIKPIPETIDRNTEGTLVCNSDGGYPKGTLHWFDHDGVEWSKSAEMEVGQTDKGLFRLTSKLTLLQGSIFSEYTCVVFNASGGKEDEVKFVTPDSPKPRDGDSSWVLQSNSIMIISVISTLVTMMTILLILLTVKLWTRSREKITCAKKVPTEDLSQDMDRNGLDSVGALGRSKQSLYNF